MTMEIGKTKFIKENTKTIPNKINMIFDFHFGVQTTQILSPHQNGL